MKLLLEYVDDLIYQTSQAKPSFLDRHKEKLIAGGLLGLGALAYKSNLLSQSHEHPTLFSLPSSQAKQHLTIGSNDQSVGLTDNIKRLWNQTTLAGHRLLDKLPKSHHNKWHRSENSDIFPKIGKKIVSTAKDVGSYFSKKYHEQNDPSIGEVEQRVSALKQYQSLHRSQMNQPNFDKLSEQIKKYDSR